MVRSGFSSVSTHGKRKREADRDDDVGAVAIPRDDFEAFDGLYVSDNVVERPWAVLRAHRVGVVVVG
jgi:hypothetical protein